MCPQSGVPILDDVARFNVVPVFLSCSSDLVGLAGDIETIWARRLEANHWARGGTRVARCAGLSHWDRIEPLFGFAIFLDDPVESFRQVDPYLVSAVEHAVRLRLGHIQSSFFVTRKHEAAHQLRPLPEVSYPWS